MKTLLELKNVTKVFGGLTAVGDVSFKVREGEIFGLIGPNGAGKTTIFNLITAIYKITSGEILFEDKSINSLRPFEIANTGITRTFQNIRLFKNLTTYENILTACHSSANYNMLNSILRDKKYRLEEEKILNMTNKLMDILDLNDRRDVNALNLPYGTQRRLEIARALALKPKILLLDEPAAGMNPEETMKLMEMISYIRKEFKITILVIEHHMDFIMNICDNIFVLNFGKGLASGTPKEIQENKKVIEAYLGGEEEELC